MSGQGKYTQYAPPNTSQNLLLNKLFRSDDAEKRHPLQDLVGKEEDAKAAIVALGRELLQPEIQQGDLGHFPNGVGMRYTTAPNLDDVVWERPGDPATAYFPDLTSPGPGKTGGTDRDANPEIATTDVQPNYAPGGPDTGTRSPSETSAAIAVGSTLGTPQTNGESGA